MTEKNTKDTIKALEAKSSVPKAEKKPLDKLYKQETVEIAGVEYTFQFPGVRRAQQILDSAKITGVFSNEIYNTRLMDEIIVQPNDIDWDYWDENEGYLEVMDKADRFLGRLLK